CTFILLSCTQQTMHKKPIEFDSTIKPPIAEIKPFLRVLHQDSVIDNYYWMIDYFKKGPDSTLVVDYLKAENNYTDKMLQSTKPFQEKLFTEIKSRIKEKDESVPYFKNGYFYYTRTEEGKQYYKYCRKKGNLDAPEEILLDVDKMAENHAYYAASGFEISEDNNLLAFGIDELSRRQYTIYIKNLATGEILKDKIENTEGDPCFAADNKTIFYTSKNKITLLSEKIKKHIIGQAAENDITVYAENDKSNYIGVGKSKNGKYIFIYSQATLSSELKFIKSTEPNSIFKSFQPRIKDVLYSVVALEDKFLIRTNLDATNFKVMECSLEKTSVENWKEVIPHRTDVLLENIEEFKDFIVYQERKNGLIQFQVKNNKNNSSYYVDFGEPTYLAYISTNVDYNSNTLRYGFTSLVTPNSQFDFDMNSKTKKILKQQEVVGGYTPENYTSERIMVKSRDGIQIPISIVYKKGFKKDGNAPVLLYGYGSYGASMDATFSISRLSLLDRGFAFVIAHIRGGQELGRKWYEDGKLQKKINTFNDFIDVGNFLVENKFTTSKHLYAKGGSAGGLLMGAVTNMSPNLWNGVIANVPFVDVINTMLDESIPLTTNEFDEWGNPKNKDTYFYMKKYSPYENVEAKEYPNMLVTTGLHDSQVQYFEPAKWVAKLRTLKKDNNVLLLKTDMDYGHGGASGRFDYIKEIALEYAFLFALEGIYE
ncbi:MAG: S9 family peptidase, partial [Sediminibacterium sp.]|nr:S9 family peptidase [Sediminibacterium sp.]